MSKCVIKTCLTNLGLDYEAGITFFRCPNVKMMRKWIESIHDNYKQVVSFDEMTTQKICSRHFSKFLIYTEPKTGAVRLMPHAIPKRLNTSISTLESDPMTSSTSATAPDVGVEVHIRNPSRISPSKVERYDDKARRSIKKLENSLEETTEKIKTFSRQALYWQKRYHGCKEQLQKANGINPYTKMPPSTENVTSSKKKIKLTVDDVNSITCRLCLTRDALVNTYSVSGFLNGVLISHSIEKYFSIKIADDDIITEVCENCLAKVDISQSIYEEFGTANKNLENLLRHQAVYVDEPKITPGDVENGVVEEKQQKIRVNTEYDLTLISKIKDTDYNEVVTDEDPYSSDEVFDDSNQHFDSLSDCSMDEHPLFVRKEKGLFYLCHLCDGEFSTNTRLEWHLYNMHELSSDNFICSYCGQTYEYQHQRLFKRHERHHEHLARAKFPCSICAQVFASPNLLKIHRKVTHLGDKPYKCDQCDKSYSTNISLKEHMLIHSDVKFPYDCGVCLRKFKNLMVKRIHTCLDGVPNSCKADPITNMCPICQEEFRKHYFLIEHIDNEHEGHNLTFFYCPHLECEKRFLDEVRLKDHLKFHSGRRNASCDICGRTFSSKTSLSEHVLNIHKKIKFHCKICNIALSSLKSLRRHRFTHTDDKPYKCNCGRTFGQKKELLSHKPKCSGKVVANQNQEILASKF